MGNPAWKRTKWTLGRAIGAALLAVALLAQYGIAAEKKGKTRSVEKPKQEVVFCANQVFYGQSTGVYTCKKLCSPYAKDIKQYMDEGWRVISSSSKEVIVQAFQEGNVPSYRWGLAGEKVEPARSFSNGCKCIGTEYIIEK